MLIFVLLFPPQSRANKITCFRVSRNAPKPRDCFSTTTLSFSWPHVISTNTTSAHTSLLSVNLRNSFLKTVPTTKRIETIDQPSQKTILRPTFTDYVNDQISNHVPPNSTNPPLSPPSLPSFIRRQSTHQHSPYPRHSNRSPRRDGSDHMRKSRRCDITPKARFASTNGETGWGCWEGCWVEWWAGTLIYGPLGETTLGWVSWLTGLALVGIGIGNQCSGDHRLG